MPLYGPFYEAVCYDLYFLVVYRPFAGLSLIGRTFREMGLLTDLMMVELMGLTTERVMEFVGKNVPPARSEFVKQTLSNNPILLSVSAITFYCAALCQVLGDENAIPLKLNTYTQITAYIMQVIRIVITTYITTLS